MKKIILLALSIAALAVVSCNKETPEVQPEKVDYLTFNAYVAQGDITKTAYENEKTFSWVGNECVSMQLINNSTSGRDRWIFYNETSAGGATASFKSSGSLNTTTWGLGEYAFYPANGNGNCPAPNSSFKVGQTITDNTAKGVSISSPFIASVSNPLQYVPMIGYKDGSDNFAFHTACGILKVTVSNIDDRLAKVRLTANGQQLCGTITMTGDGDAAYYALAASSSDNSLDIVYSDRAAETELPFYFPVPVGTLASGFTVSLLDATDVVLKTVTAPVDVLIERNKISVITKAIALPAEDFSATVTATGTSVAIKANVDIAKDATSVKVVLAATEAVGAALIDADDASVVTFTADGETALPMTNVTTSGTAYLVAKTYAGTEEQLVYSVPVYVLTAADEAAIISRYSRDLASSGTLTVAGFDLTGDNTITLAVSNNPLVGNIMITEFAGYCYDVSESTHSYYTLDWSKFTDGSPLYGIYGNGITYDGFAGATFANADQNVFYSDAGGHTHYVSACTVNTKQIELAFNSTANGNGVAHDLVVNHKWIGNAYNYTGGYDIYFTNYVGFKTKGMIDLTGKVSVSSTGANNNYSGDNTGAAALIDKNTGTHWHSDYVSVPPADPTYGIYIDIDLGDSKTLNDFTLKFMSRNSPNQIPTKFIVGGSNDNATWSTLTDVTTISLEQAKWYQARVTSSTAYRYIRLGFTESVAGDLTSNPSTSKYVALAELQLWEN